MDRDGSRINIVVIAIGRGSQSVHRNIELYRLFTS